MRAAKLSVILAVIVLGGFVVLDGMNRGESYPALLLVVAATVVALLPWVTAPEGDPNARRWDALTTGVSRLTADTSAIRASLRPEAEVARRSAWYRTPLPHRFPAALAGLVLGIAVVTAIRHRRRGRGA